MSILDKFTWFNVCRAGLIDQIKDNVSKFKATRDEVNGATALMHACIDNNIDVVRILLPYEDTVTDNTGKTGLMIVAEHGYLELSKLLMTTQIGKQRENGQTALMHAAAYDFDEIVDLLLPREGTMTDKNGWTALMYAVWRGANKAALSLVKVEAGLTSNQGETAFLCACDSGNYDLAKLLLEKEGSTTLRSGETGLHLAARNGSLAIVELLLETLCRKQTRSGKTALMYAASAGNVSIAKLLLEKEAGFQDTEGQTATMSAILNGHEECMKILLPHEADIIDKGGKTALDIAQRSGSSSMACHVAALLGGTIDPLTRKTTLIQATENGLYNIVKILLPIQSNLSDESGMYAIHYAVERMDLECIKLLKPYEGKAFNSDGQHALILAVKGNNIDIVSELSEYCWLPDLNNNYPITYCEGGPLSNIYQLLFSRMILIHPNFKSVVLSFCKALHESFLHLIDEYSDKEYIELLSGLLLIVSGLFFNPEEIAATQILPNITTLLDNFTSEVHDFPCCVCIDRPAFVIIQPCMHMCICNQCIASLRGRCPYCQVAIADHFEITLDV